jgi:hypothetical protein
MNRYGFGDDDMEEHKVARTASDAIMSKYSAVKLGYYEDKFVECFNKGSVQRKIPLINRGYYARVKCIRMVKDKFLKQTEGTKRQLLILGSGLDSTGLNAFYDGHKNVSVFEVDFDNVNNKKASVLFSNKATKDVINSQCLVRENDCEEPENESISLQASRTPWGYSIGRLALISSNLAEDCTEALYDKLEKAGLDWALPTMIISECVLVYLERDTVNALLRKICERFARCDSDVLWLSYDMYNPADPFGLTMVENMQVGSRISAHFLYLCFSLSLLCSAEQTFRFSSHNKL